MSGDDIEDGDELESWLGRISTRIDFLGEVYQSRLTVHVGRRVVLAHQEGVQIGERAGGVVRGPG